MFLFDDFRRRCLFEGSVNINLPMERFNHIYLSMSICDVVSADLGVGFYS